MSSSDELTGRIVVAVNADFARKLAEHARTTGDVTTFAEAADAVPDLRELYDLVTKSLAPELTKIKVKSRSTRVQAELEEELMGQPHGRRGLVGFFTLDARNLSADDAKRLVGALRQVNGVQSAYEEQRSRSPKKGASSKKTPNVLASSPLGHLDRAPFGVSVHSAEHGWVQFGGSGVGFADIEARGVEWNLDHEFFSHVDRSTLHCPHNVFPHGDFHGTETLGVIFSGRDHPARGIAPHGVLRALLTVDNDEDGLEDIAGAILEAAGFLARGDVLLLELQTARNLPIEVSDDVFSAIQLAVAKGIVVVEAAGNGHQSESGGFVGYDLDEVGRDLDLAPAWARRDHPDSPIPDSGAILVSGCEAGVVEKKPPVHRRGAGCNFGSRVDCFAWGERVQTTGDTLSGEANVNRRFADTFDGTSAASAIIAGLALLIQERAAKTGTRLTPEDVRALLRTAAGTRVIGRTKRVVPAFRDMIQHPHAPPPAHP